MGSEPLLDRVIAVARRCPRAIAVDVPNGRTLTYEDLVAEIERAAAVFRALGLHPGARVAILAPATVQTVVDILALMTLGTVVPLNPASTREELRESVTVAAATLIARDDDGNAMTSDFDGARTGTGRDGSAVFLFRTSGTTGGPKNVPLSERNVGAGVTNVVSALGLTERDTCLLMMPLFHVHGLIGCAFATLVSGGRLIVPGAPRAVEAMDWLNTREPTWYSAAPTVHRAMLARANLASPSQRRSLRLIRSCSAALPHDLYLDLRRAFRVPVVSAYGMTEASHQVASTSFDGPQGDGDVGMPMGCEVVIRGEDGSPVDPDELGEVWIRGENVMTGYEPADTTVDSTGALRTGDLGRIDPHGRLWLHGRTKELINKGGEKVSPAEIDAALISIPGVLEASAFALPDDRLGEDVAAAIVVRSGATLTAEDVRDRLERRLASFKVPSRIFFVDALPKTPSGKVVRDRLSGSLSPADREPIRPTAGPAPMSVEEVLVAVWKDVLRVDEISLDDDFFELGGDSLSAADLVLRVSERFGNEPTLTSFFASPTVSGMATMIGARGVAPRAARRAVVPLRSKGMEPPLFLVHGASFSVDEPPLFLVHGASFSVDHYRGLARHLRPGVPVVGVQEDLFRSPPYLPEDLPALARHYVSVMRSEQPHGPYRLGGASSAGIIALEIARVLRADGETVQRLVLIDASPTWLRGSLTWLRFRVRMLRRLSNHAAMRWVRGSVRAKLARRGQRAAALQGDFGESIATRVARLSGNLEYIVRSHRPSPLDVPTLAVVTAESQMLWGDPTLHWKNITPDLETVAVGGTHYHVLDQPTVVDVAAAVSARLPMVARDDAAAQAVPLRPRYDADSAPIQKPTQRAG